VVKRLNGSLDLTSDHTRALSATIRFIALGLGIAAINLPNFKSLSSTQYEDTKGEGPTTENNSLCRRYLDGRLSPKSASAGQKAEMKKK